MNDKKEHHGCLQHGYLDTDSPIGVRHRHEPDDPTGWAVGWLVIGIAIGVIVSIVILWLYT